MPHFLARFRLLTLSLLAGALTMHAAEPLVLVRDGQPVATIVVQADAPKPQQAAEALQTYIARMTGATLPLVTDTDPAPDGVTIQVGTTRAAAELDLPIPAGFDPTPRPDYFEEEGYLIRTVDDMLIIAGNNDGSYYGTLYGAYAFLRGLGCRWYFPGDYGEIVPRQQTIQVEPMDILSKPDFTARAVSLGGWLPSSKEEKAIYQEWQYKVGMTVERPYPVAGDGFLAYLVPPGEYFDEHPEYFAMGEDGQRHRGKSVRHTMLCLSNEAVFETAVKTLGEMRDGTREFGYYKNGLGISPPDGVPYCYCKECQAASQNFQYPRYVHRTSQSEEFFSFAARLARTFPDIFIGTMAYSLREIAPHGVEIPPNMAVCIAPISNDVLHPNDSHLWRRRDFIRNLERWRSKTPHITIYDYNPGLLLGSWVPERDAANLAVNIPIYKQLGIKGLTREGRKAFMQTWISNYVMARMLWDADIELETIKADFYTTFFGPEAGPHVRAWWDACEERLVQSEMQAHEDWLINHLYTEDFARSLMPHVEAAQAAAATPEQQRRVDDFALIADHLLAYGEMMAAEEAMEYALAAAAAGRMLQRERELHERYSFFHEYRKDQEMRRYFPGGRQQHFLEAAAKTDGTRGELVAKVPLETTFQRDPFNEGIVGGWFETEVDTTSWERKNTFLTWDQQDQPLDEAGHHYDGYGWYRFSYEVPEAMAGRPIHFFCGGAINEAWVWVNGEYAGHKTHKIWWSGPHSFELDITDMTRPGEANTIAIRVGNNAEIGGLYRRGFVWAANAEQQR